MVDMNQPIAKILEGIARVELEFPDTKAKFPVITITEINNKSDYEVENTELISDITYQVDVWDNGKNRKLCEDISTEVSKALTKANFTRILGRGFKDPSGLHRKMMYFKTKIINKGEI